MVVGLGESTPAARDLQSAYVGRIGMGLSFAEPLDNERKRVR